MVLAELGGAIKGALSKLNNATVIDEEGACVTPAAKRVAPQCCGSGRCAAPLTDPRVPCACPDDTALDAVLKEICTALMHSDVNSAPPTNSPARGVLCRLPVGLCSPPKG